MFYSHDHDLGVFKYIDELIKKNLITLSLKSEVCTLKSFHFVIMVSC